VIVVIGEALVDLVIAPSGAVEAVLGGAPYNTARAAARLGADVEFVGGLSVDRFGSQLRSGLDADGVRTSFAVWTEAPTTLAAAEIGEDGSAAYRFYFDGTSAPLVGPHAAGAAVSSLGSNDILFTGGLALVLEPMATSVTAAIATLDGGTVLMIDVNSREAVIPDRAAYVDRVHRAASRADIVKVSDEDLAYLSPTLDPPAAARRLLDVGAQAIVVTAGASHTTIVTAAGEATVEVPAVPGHVVDTIGAGDTFGAGMLAWWSAAGAGRADVSIENLAAAVRVGHAAAGVVVTRRGADPPRRDELDVDWP
jgi:fructokinase